MKKIMHICRTCSHDVPAQAAHTLCPPGGAAILHPARHSPTGCQNLQQHEHTHSLFESASLYALLWNRFRSFDGLLHDLWDRHVNDLFRDLRQWNRDDQVHHAHLLRQHKMLRNARTRRKKNVRYCRDAKADSCACSTR